MSMHKTAGRSRVSASPSLANGQLTASFNSKPVVRIGVLYSLTGPYGMIGREMLKGLLLALEEANNDDSFAFFLEPVIRDPGGSLDAYHSMCSDLLYQQGIRHLTGCYTSASRKRVLPLVEGARALLWHCARYEGFESSENVIYLGATPNQHVLPLLHHVVQHHPAVMYNVGSNYVWSWEIHRIAREAMAAVDGRILSEQLVTLGAQSVDAIVADIVSKRPSIVLNTLVGQSAYAFYEAWHAASRTHAYLASESVTRLSLTLCEPEVPVVGIPSIEGCLVSSVYFQSIDSERNRRFRQAFVQAFGPDGVPCVDSESAYLSGVFLVRSISACGSDEPAKVRQAACQQIVDAPQGQVRIDPGNNHAYLTPRIARCNASGDFDIVWQAAQPLKPDPYLASVELSELRPRGRSGMEASRTKE